MLHLLSRTTNYLSDNIVGNKFTFINKKGKPYLKQISPPTDDSLVMSDEEYNQYRNICNPFAPEVRLDIDKIMEEFKFSFPLSPFLYNKIILYLCYNVWRNPLRKYRRFFNRLKVLVSSYDTGPSGRVKRTIIAEHVIKKQDQSV